MVPTEVPPLNPKPYSIDKAPAQNYLNPKPWQGAWSETEPLGDKGLGLGV